MMLASGGRQRLHELEREIRGGIEEFYRTGMKLKEIRDDELYKEDGFATWEAYCRERWEWKLSYSNYLIRAAHYREALPTPTTIGGEKNPEWSERSVRELTRIPDKRDAARVAAKVVKAVEQSEKEAEKNPDVKPMKLTASTVRKFVDEDLGVNRAEKAKETKRKREEEEKPMLHRFVSDMIGRIAAEVEMLETVPEDALGTFCEQFPGAAQRCITAVESLATWTNRLKALALRSQGSSQRNF